MYFFFYLVSNVQLFANVMNSVSETAAESRAESAGIAIILSIANRLHFARQQAIA